MKGRLKREERKKGRRERKGGEKEREERKKGRRERKGGEKEREEKKKGGEKKKEEEKHHRGSNPGPSAWKVRTLTVDRPRLLIACTYYTDIYRESRLT